MNPTEEYTYNVHTRYYSYTYLATCHGQTASSTNSAAVAAVSAASKHWATICALSKWNPASYSAKSKSIGNGFHLVTFTPIGGKP